MELFMQINDAINGFVWGPVMLLLLVGTGVYISVRTKFLQFRKFGYAMRNTIGGLFTGRARKTDESNISPFQAVSTALASTVGTGNVVGVATAITLGGPGAVFWMWVSAIFGMMTKYAEIVLAVRFREVNADGLHVGGPMYYLSNGMKNKKLGKILGALFAFLVTFASFGIGCMTQSNSISTALNNTFGFSPTIVGIVVSILVGVVILGGIKSIARVTEFVVPFMATFFILFSIIILIINASAIPEALRLIFVAAFNPEAAFGGAVGYTVLLAVRMGIARGVFSNEAGLGSAPIAHAASSTKEPVEQGLWGIFEVFVDTILVCSMTALVIVTSGLYTAEHGLEGAALTIEAFNVGLPGNIGGIGLTIGLTLFALSTLFGWSYYGERGIEYFFRHTSGAKAVTMIYKAAFVIASFIGAVGGLQLVWGIADTLNGLMAIPNLIGVAALSGIVFAETKKYFNNH